MSVWALGRVPEGRAIVEAADNPLAKFVGKVLKWIPADLAVLYAASIKALVDNAEDDKNLWITAGAILLAPVTVWLIARSSDNGATGRVLRIRMLLCLPAMAIWSLTVPNSGWDQIKFVSDNPGLIVVLAAAAGFFFSLVAEVIERGR